MADWYGVSRTNYVEMKDVDKFYDFAEEHDLNIYEKHQPESDTSLIAFSMNTESGWIECPEECAGCEEEDEDHDPVDEFFQDVQKHIADDNVLVCMVAGHEGMRYITGDAYAMDNAGNMCQVGLNDIYPMAKEKFGEDVRITDCCY